VGAFSPNGILEQQFSLKKLVMEKHFSWKLRRGRKILARKGVKKKLVPKMGNEKPLCQKLEQWRILLSENGVMEKYLSRKWDHGVTF
jgi:hypothetical protein